MNFQRVFKPALLASLIGVASVMSGCGGGSSSSNPNTPPPSTQASTKISGKLVLGAVSGATINVYATNGKGVKGALLGTTTSDATGSYVLTLPATVTADTQILIEAKGGTYQSEADTSQTRPLDHAMLSLATIKAHQTSTVNVTALTHIMTLRAQQLLAANQNFAAAIDTAQKDLQKLLGNLGLASGALLSQSLPDFKASNGLAYYYAFLLATLEQGSLNASLNGSELVSLCAQDLSDGVADGMNEGTTILQANGVAMGGALCSSGLNAAAFSLVSQSGSNSGTTTVYSNSGVSLTGAQTAVTAATAASAGTIGATANSSGAITTLEYYDTNGKPQKRVYVAGRNDGLGIVNVNDPAHPVSENSSALNQLIKNSGMSSVGGVIAVSNSGKPSLILFDYSSPTILKVDLTNNTVSKLTLTINGSLSFSGANAVIAGGLLDTVNGGVWLATADGMVKIDPVTMKRISSIAAPANTVVNENIGGDPSLSLVLSPDYEGDGAGMVAYKLNEGKAYVQPITEWNTLFPQIPNYELDQVSMDTSYKLAVVTSEEVPILSLLHTPKITYNTTAMTMSIPASGTAHVDLRNDSKGNSCTGIYRLSASATDASSHLSLLASGNNSSLAVVSLKNPATAIGTSVLRTYSSANFYYAGDPHGIGTATLSDKRTYGFVLTADNHLLMIDLRNFLAAPTNPACDTQLATDPVKNTSITKSIALN